MLGGAANEIGAALDPIFARIGFAQGAIVAFLGAAGPNRDTIAVATLLALAASTVTDASRAEGARAAVAIVAAFGAIPAFATSAAEEILAAVALGAGTIGDRAGFTRIAATGPFVHAGVLAAFLTLGAGAATRSLDADLAITRAIGIRATFATPAPAGRFAAGQIATAGHPRVVTRFTDLLATGADRGADIVAAFLTIRAWGIGKASAADAVATWAFVVLAALAWRPAFIAAGAAILRTGAPGDAGALDAFPANGNTVGIGTALISLAGPAGAGLAKRAIFITATDRAVVIGSTRVAAFLPGCADRSILAKAIAVAECFAAFVFALVRAIAIDAALRIAGALTAKAVLAIIDADTPVANVAGVADFRIAGARNGVADGARVGAEILVDALPAIA